MRCEGQRFSAIVCYQSSCFCLDFTTFHLHLADADIIFAVATGGKWSKRPFVTCFRTENLSFSCASRFFCLRLQEKRQAFAVVLQAQRDGIVRA